jgi:Flp pilus assembly protein protease CpaA
MINLIAFLVGLVFLIYFSYKDLKFRQINNTPILILFIAGVILSIISINTFSFYVLWAMLGVFFFILWDGFDAIGGADTKILISLIPFIIINSENIYSDSLIFICIFLIIGLIYGIVAKYLLKKTKEKPFIHIITFIYVLFWLFKFLNN